jgi:CRP-like cAMP-binding protein
MYCFTQGCTILAISKQMFQKICEEFPQFEKNLLRIEKAIEAADRISIIRELDEKRKLQQMKVRELVQCQMKKQVFYLANPCKILTCL